MRSIEKKLRRARKAQRDILDKSQGSRNGSADRIKAEMKQETGLEKSDFNFGDVDEKQSPTLDFLTAIKNRNFEEAAEILKKKGSSNINLNHADSNQLSSIHYAVLHRN